MYDEDDAYALDLDLDDIVKSRLQFQRPPAAPHPPAPARQRPIIRQSGQDVQTQQARRIPGPAGDPGHSPSHRDACRQAPLDKDFSSSVWLSALQTLDIGTFDVSHPLLRGNTVSAAYSMPHTGTLPKLLALVSTLCQSYAGESFTRLKDPTGAIGATLTADIFNREPDLVTGSVVLLEKVTVIRTPPPCPLHHLCITAENIVQVIAPGEPLGPRLTAMPLPLPSLRPTHHSNNVGPTGATDRQQQQHYQQQVSVPPFQRTWQHNASNAAQPMAPPPPPIHQPPQWQQQHVPAPAHQQPQQLVTEVPPMRRDPPGQLFAAAPIPQQPAPPPLAEVPQEYQEGPAADECLGFQGRGGDGGEGPANQHEHEQPQDETQQQDNVVLEDNPDELMLNDDDDFV